MTANGELKDWSVTAVNLPQHASNPIHTDAGAQAAGFPRALVAGVSSYALMTHVPTAAWGDAWSTGGGAHVRFEAPVFDGDPVEFVVVDRGVGDRGVGDRGVGDRGVGDRGVGHDATIELRVDGERRASCELLRNGPRMATRDGERLEPRTFTPGIEWSDYGDRLGDPDGRYGERQLIHPAAWVAFANDVFHTQLVNGSWIHTRSLVAHHGTVTLGDPITIETTVVDRFTSRAGKRAIADVRITSDGRPVASIEHEAVIELAE